MKQFLLFTAIAVMASCNNSKKEKATTESGKTETTASTSPDNTTPTNTNTNSGATNSQVTIDGKEFSLSSSILVTKDKENLKPGNDWVVIMTASGGPNQESVTVNFLLDKKPGVYPVVGLGLSRQFGENGEVFGGLLGGKPKLTNYTVNITEMKDLGDNGTGGHKWSISGNYENITIPAMQIMLYDKSKNHPKEVVLNKGSFSNLTFDDNWEELMENIGDKLKNN